MNNQLIPFNFENRQIRTVAIDSEFWFVAKDVITALDYPSSCNPAGLCKHVPNEWKGIKRIYTPGGEQNMVCLSEQGLYFFAARSDKEKAIPFQKWIAGEVLPQIRQTGGYSAAGQTVDLAAINTLIKLQAETTASLSAINTFIKESEPRVKLFSSEKDRLRRLTRLYEENERLRQQLARKNTPLTENEKRQILSCASRWSVAEIARFAGRSETAVRDVIKKGRAA